MGGKRLKLNFQGLFFFLLFFNPKLENILFVDIQDTLPFFFGGQEQNAPQY